MHQLPRRLLLSLALCAAAAPALADTFPSRPLKLMVPYAPGGAADITARLVADPLGQALGQPVVIENLGGASGTVGSQKVLQAPADGYQILYASPSELILPPLANPAVRLNAEDFVLVQPITEGVLVLITRPGLPVKTMDDFVELARSRADKPLIFGNMGVGSIYHLIMESAQETGRFGLVNVPYQGFSPLLPDLTSGRVDFTITAFSPLIQQYGKEGKLGIIGQFGATRSELLKDVHTAAESKTLRGLHASIWGGLFVKKGTPAPILKRLSEAMAKVLGDEQVRKAMLAQSKQPPQPMKLQEAAAMYTQETARFRAIASKVFK